MMVDWSCKDDPQLGKPEVRNFEMQYDDDGALLFRVRSPFSEESLLDLM